MKVGVILNPIAGGGRLSRRWPKVSALLRDCFGDVEMRETQSSGDAARLAQEFAESGKDLVIAAGGDGTASEAADGLLRSPAEDVGKVELGLLPCGTGVDFARGLDLESDPEAAIRRIARGTGVRVDAGRITYVDDNGAVAKRHFINIAGLGMSGATDRAVNADKRKGRMSGKALFLWRTVIEFLRYRFQDVRITIDDGDPIEARIALVAVANGKYFGGGMMIAPDAELDDGLFDIVILRAANKLKLIMDIRLLYDGNHRDHEAITILRGKRVLVEPLDDLASNCAFVDIDGDSPGRMPAAFEILPKALILRW